MFDDTDAKKKKTGFEIGQKLDDLSIEELEETINTLKMEIERLSSARTSKSQHLSEAAALFARKS